MKKYLIFLYILTLLNACGSENKTKPEDLKVENSATQLLTLSDAQYKNAGIETATPQRRNIASVLKVNGKIEVPPQNIVSISIPMGGYLKSTRLIQGMQIKKGEVLAIIEDQQYIQLQQDYLTSKTQFGFIESEYKRQKELNKNKAASDKVYEQAKASFETQLILIKSLEEKLKLIGINPDRLSATNISKSIPVYSPINGFVSVVNVNVGKYVNPSEVLFELINPNDIHLTLTVFEKDIHKLSIGQNLWAYSNSNSQKKYACSILLISKNVSEDNATQIHCHFKEFDKNLLPGMYMNADIEWMGSNTLVLPEEAIVRFENKQYAFIVLGKNKFEMKELQTGISENGFTELLNADALTNEQFATKGAYNLLMTLKNSNEE